MMQQAKFSLTDTLIEFLKSHKSYGYKDKSSMVRAALMRLKEELELQSLRHSAELYAELYESEPEHGELAEAGLEDWPE